MPTHQIVSTIIAIQIAFDASKNEINVRERGLNFALALDFDFNTAIVEQDIRKTYPAARFVAVGLLGSRLHVLCFTPAAGGIRVISFRNADTREVKHYDQAHTND